MTKITYRPAIAIAQLIFFIISLGLGLLLCSRHGFTRSSGWVLLITFSLLRMTGAICQLIAIDDPSTSVIAAVVVCISIGVSPLTLLCLALLSRVNRFIFKPLPSLLFRSLGILSIAGVILGLYGGIKSSSANGPFVQAPETKAAVAVFALIYVLVVLLLCYLCFPHQRSSVRSGEQRLLVAVAVASPFLAVRILYALICDFANDMSRWNSYFGNTTIYLCMAVLTEFVITTLCVAVGLTLRRLPKDVDEQMEGDEAVALQVISTDTTQDVFRNENGNVRGKARTKGRQGQYQQQDRGAGSGNIKEQIPRKKITGGPISLLYGYTKRYLDERNVRA